MPPCLKENSGGGSLQYRKHLIRMFFSPANLAHGGVMHLYPGMARAAVAAFIMFVSATACSKAPVKQEKATVNLQPTRLAIMPEGYESEEFYFSEDGRRLAYAVKKDGKVFLVEGGKESQRYNDLHRVVFSPDGRSVAYRAMGEGQESVVIDGKSENSYESIGEVQFAPDGRVVYEAQKNGKWLVVSGRRESPAFDMPFAAPFMSPDGKKMAYIEQHYKPDRVNLVVCSLDMGQRTKGKEYDAIGAIRKSAASSRIAYAVRKSGKQTVVTMDFAGSDRLHEVEGPYYDEIVTLDIADDGAHLAYVARRDKNFFLVKDGVELPFPEHEMRSHTIFAKDGRAVNVGVLRERFFTIADGKKTGDTYDGIKDPVFSPDGSLLAFAARRGDRHHVVVNGIAGPPYDMVVAPQFSPDGSRLIYRVRQDGKRFVVVADARGNTLAEQARYELVWQPVFAPDGKSIAYAVKNGREIWWKVEPLP